MYVTAKIASREIEKIISHPRAEYFEENNKREFRPIFSYIAVMEAMRYEPRKDDLERFIKTLEKELSKKLSRSSPIFISTNEEGRCDTWLKNLAMKEGIKIEYLLPYSMNMVIDKRAISIKVGNIEKFSFRKE